MKIGVVMIALNEELYIGASLRSILNHPAIAKIAVVEGCVRHNEHARNVHGLSADKTANEIMDVIDGDDEGKIIYHQLGYCNGKAEMRNKALKLIGFEVDYILIVDADELWRHEDLDFLVAYLESHPEVYSVNLFGWHFWKRPDCIRFGNVWDIPFFSVFKFADRTLHWREHEAPVVNLEGVRINKLGKEVDLDVRIFHYGYLKPALNVQEKLEFYRKRDTHLVVQDHFTDWNENEITNDASAVAGVKYFHGEHPREFAAIKFHGKA